MRSLFTYLITTLALSSFTFQLELVGEFLDDPAKQEAPQEKTAFVRSFVPSFVRSFVVI